MERKPMSNSKVQPLGRASDDEALRLTVAFYCIMEPEGRAEVLALAETLATRSARGTASAPNRRPVISRLQWLVLAEAVLVLFSARWR